MPERYDVMLCVEHARVSSAELTEALGVSPDQAWDAGATFLIRDQTKQHRNSRWSLLQRAEAMDGVCEAVDRLMKRVLVLKSNFGSLPQGSSISLEMALTTREALFAISFSNEQSRLLESLGASMDLSVAKLIDPSGNQSM